MERTLIRSIYADCEAFGGKTVTLGGWVRNLRASNAFGFIELNDGTFFKPVQVVFESEFLDNYKGYNWIIPKQNGSLMGH